MWHYDFMLPAVKKYVDVDCVQAYGPWEKDRKLCDMIYETTGKPIFNSDGCCGLEGPNQQEWGVKGFRTGAKFFDQLAPLLQRLPDDTCERDTSNNRKLSYDQYGTLMLLYFFNPIATSLRGLQQASELKNVQKKRTEETRLCSPERMVRKPRSVGAIQYFLTQAANRLVRTSFPNDTMTQ